LNAKKEASKLVDGFRLLFLLKDAEKVLDKIENATDPNMKLTPEERSVFAKLQVALERRSAPKAE